MAFRRPREQKPANADTMSPFTVTDAAGAYPARDHTFHE